MQERTHIPTPTPQHLAATVARVPNNSYFEPRFRARAAGAWSPWATIANTRGSRLRRSSAARVSGAVMRPDPDVGHQHAKPLACKAHARSQSGTRPSHAVRVGRLNKHRRNALDRVQPKQMREHPQTAKTRASRFHEAAVRPTRSTLWAKDLAPSFRRQAGVVSPIQQLNGSAANDALGSRRSRLGESLAPLGRAVMHVVCAQRPNPATRSHIRPHDGQKRPSRHPAEARPAEAAQKDVALRHVFATCATTRGV